MLIGRTQAIQMPISAAVRAAERAEEVAQGPREAAPVQHRFARAAITLAGGVRRSQRVLRWEA